MKKAVSVFILFCMMFSVVACTKGNDITGETDTSGSTAAETDYLDTLPEFNGNGASISILVTTQLENFYIQDEISDVAVDSACWRRNKNVEERYNVKLEYEALDGNKSGANAFSTAVRTSVASGTEPYDIVIGQQYYCLPLATEGMYRNLLESTVINWDADWYHSSINDVGTIQGRLYGASGDFVISQFAYAMALVYNKDIYADYKFDDNLYDLVREGRWTYEKLKVLATSFEGGSENEVYGMVSYDHCIQGFVIGCGIDFAVKDKDGLWSADEFYNDTLETIYESLRQLFNDYGTIPARNEEKPINADKTLFTGMYVHGLIEDKQFKNTDCGFGILPFPKYDENQDDYRTNVMRGELFYVPENADFERAELLLEALNYETNKLVLPEYWNNALELKSADTTDDRDMFKIILSTLYYDFAKYFEADMNSFNWSVTSCIQKNTATFSTWWGTNGRTLKQYIAAINENYGQAGE